MTWVLGFPGMFNSALVADSRISYPKLGTYETEFVVLKIHQVGAYTICGFAGDIEEGFTAIDYLRDLLNGPDPWDGGNYPDVDQIGRIFVERARSLVAAPGDLDLLLLGAERPQRARDEHGAEIGFDYIDGRCSVIRMRPDGIGDPTLYDDARFPPNIGSGAHLQHYQRTLSEVADPNHFMTHMHDPVFSSALLVEDLKDAIRSRPVQPGELEGVNDQLHLGLITLGGVQIREALRWEHEVALPVARTREEYRALRRQHGRGTAEAIA